MILVFDTETTGLPARGEVITSPSYPHLVEIAGLLIEVDREVSCFHMVVKPEGWVIPKEAAAVHGITQERALEIGVPLRLAVACYTNFLRVVDRVVGHNVEFDVMILAAAINRCRADPANHIIPNPTCTANLGVEIARLPATERMVAAGRGEEFKRPKLSELYQFLFKEELVNAHSALVDARAAARCWLEIERRAGK